jgi:hypothetical protein
VKVFVMLDARNDVVGRYFESTSGPAEPPVHVALPTRIETTADVMVGCAWDRHSSKASWRRLTGRVFACADVDRAADGAAVGNVVAVGFAVVTTDAVTTDAVTTDVVTTDVVASVVASVVPGRRPASLSACRDDGAVTSGTRVPKFCARLGAADTHAPCEDETERPVGPEDETNRYSGAVSD